MLFPKLLGWRNQQVECTAWQLMNQERTVSYFLVIWLSMSYATCSSLASGGSSNGTNVTTTQKRPIKILWCSVEVQDSTEQKELPDSTVLGLFKLQQPTQSFADVSLARMLEQRTCCNERLFTSTLHRWLIGGVRSLHMCHWLPSMLVSSGRAIKCPYWCHGCPLVFGPLGWQLKGNTWSTIINCPRPCLDGLGKGYHWQAHGTCVQRSRVHPVDGCEIYQEDWWRQQGCVDQASREQLVVSLM